MRIDVPFYSSFAIPGHPLGVNCLETSLKMLLAYFWSNREFTLEELEAITKKKPGKGSWTTSYSLWLVKNNFEVIHFTEFDYKAFKQQGIEYIREMYGNEIADWQRDKTDYQTALDEADEYMEKIQFVKRKPKVGDIVDAMKNGYVVRASVDSGLLNDTDVYEGHSVIVVGFDDDNIWFHDPGLPALENRKVTKNLFQNAMDKFGGEMDLIKQK